MRVFASVFVCLAIVTLANAQETVTRASRSSYETNQQVAAVFAQAWIASGNGGASKESLVLLYQTSEGLLQARLVKHTNEFEEFRFKWDPSAIAIVHTHPYTASARPSEQDKQVADKLQVPIFTITRQGMYIYNPGLKQTCKVQDGLGWLKPNGWRLDFCLKE